MSGDPSSAVTAINDGLRRARLIFIVVKVVIGNGDIILSDSSGKRIYGISYGYSIDLLNSWKRPQVYIWTNRQHVKALLQWILDLPECILG